jgi:hypothetical protein
MSDPVKDVPEILAEQKRFLQRIPQEDSDS